MNPKNMKKSLIHENADANITCDFSDGDISRLGVAYLTGSIQTTVLQTELLCDCRKYPNYYYKLSFSIPGCDKTLEILMIDTVMLCGNSDDFTDSIPSGPVSLGRAESQWQWIRDNLRASK